VSRMTDDELDALNVEINSDGAESHMAGPIKVSRTTMRLQLSGKE